MGVCIICIIELFIFIFELLTFILPILFQNIFEINVYFYSLNMSFVFALFFALKIKIDNLVTNSVKIVIIDFIFILIAYF